MGALINWISQNQLSSSYLDIKLFLPYLHLDTWGDKDTDIISNLHYLMEDQEQKERILNADLSFPILVTNDHRVIDGVHRICKAVYKGEQNILVSFVDRLILEQFRMSSNLLPVSTNTHLPIADIYLSIALERLPEDEQKRRQIIETYFSDHLPSATREENRWVLSLERPQEQYGCYLHDQTLRQGLEWWHKGTQIHDIPFERRILKGGILAIEDQWIPYSWSLYLQNHPAALEEVVLIHLDDHQDMMVPRIGCRFDGGQYDLITGNSFSISDPTSVQNAILSGAIGKGSILTSLIWSVKKIHVRHLAYRPHPCSHYHIERVSLQDDLLSGQKNRTGLRLVPTSKTELQSSSNYTVSPDIDECLEDIPDNVPILFHIDMDYFNNRYDGCSDWRDNKRIHELSLDRQLRQVEAFFKALTVRNLGTRIVDTSIGISAGFYPGEYWSVTLPKVIDECRKAGINFGE